MTTTPLLRLNNSAQALCKSSSGHFYTAFFVIYICLYIRDASYNRLGSSNGRFISFVDTILNVAAYRSGHLGGCMEKCPRVLQYVHIVFLSFVLKFGSGAVVSLILFKNPVFMHSTRHVMSLIIGLVIVWLAPQDIVYAHMKHSRVVRLLLSAGSALYKLRKAIFCVEAAANDEGGFVLALLLTSISVDGNSVARRCVQWLQKDRGGTSERSLKRKNSLSNLANTLLDLDDGGGSIVASFMPMLLKVMFPMGLVTTALWSANAGYITASILTKDISLDVRVLLLVFFMWRANVFQELYLINEECVAVEKAKQEAALKRDKTLEFDKTE